MSNIRQMSGIMREREREKGYYTSCTHTHTLHEDNDEGDLSLTKTIIDYVKQARAQSCVFINTNMRMRVYD